MAFKGLELALKNRFDVLLCDIGLPTLDGYELIRRLREKTRTRVPYCIALSGYGRLEDRRQAIGAGFDQYMVKPIDLNGLVKLLEFVPIHAYKSGEGNEQLPCDLKWRNMRLTLTTQP